MSAAGWVFWAALLALAGLGALWAVLRIEEHLDRAAPMTPGPRAPSHAPAARAISLSPFDVPGWDMPAMLPPAGRPAAGTPTVTAAAHLPGDPGPPPSHPETWSHWHTQLIPPIHAEAAKALALDYPPGIPFKFWEHDEFVESLGGPDMPLSAPAEWHREMGRDV